MPADREAALRNVNERQSSIGLKSSETIGRGRASSARQPSAPNGGALASRRKLAGVDGSASVEVSPDGAGQTGRGGVVADKLGLNTLANAGTPWRETDLRIERTGVPKGTRRFAPHR